MSSAPATARFAAVVLLAAALFAPPALAQAVSDQDLRAFAAATAKIRLIDRDYTIKKDGKSDAERAALSKEEDAANLAAVQGAGLTPTRYNAISKAMQDDPALAKKAYEYIYAAPVK
ncbi:MAG: DUF4168 domain-containing protein [Alphaproteobacteria bacterium]